MTSTEDPLPDDVKWESLRSHASRNNVTVGVISLRRSAGMLKQSDFRREMTASGPRWMIRSDAGITPNKHLRVVEFDNLMPLTSRRICMLTQMVQGPIFCKDRQFTLAMGLSDLGLAKIGKYGRLVGAWFYATEKAAGWIKDNQFECVDLLDE